MRARYLCTFIAVILLTLPLAANAQRGAMVLHQNLAQMVKQASYIVRGRVVSARVEQHPQFENLATVVVTLRVEETLKGQVGETYTFRQYIWDIRDRFNAAGYRKGQHLLLLLRKPSEYGLSSPIGLSQGRFRIRTDAEGNLHAVNGAGNLGLLRGVEIEPQPQSPPEPPPLVEPPDQEEEELELEGSRRSRPRAQPVRPPVRQRPVLAPSRLAEIVRQHRGGPLPLEQLRDLIRALARSARRLR
ncbi:MAG: hypothetical protein ACE5HB_01840 [Terriglobia bacterium]